MDNQENLDLINACLKQMDESDIPVSLEITVPNLIGKDSHVTDIGFTSYGTAIDTRLLNKKILICMRDYFEKEVKG